MKLNRYWRAFFVSLCVCAILGALAVSLAPKYAGLYLLALYCIPANSVLPIPHEPAVLYFAKFYSPFWVALAATIGSIAVSFADYALVEAAMRHPKISGARDARLFKWAIRWMKRSPFWIVVLFSLVPLPISIIRVLAPASEYPISRYVPAQIVGRFPRFFLLALLGRWIAIPGWILLLMFVALVAFTWLSSRKSPEVVEAPDEDDDELTIPDLHDPEHPAASRH